MDILFLEAPFTGEVSLLPKSIKFLKDKHVKTVGLYASVQFCNNLDKVKKKLQELNIEMISSQPDRTHVSNQLLGCDNYHNSLNLPSKEQSKIEYYLYIGDGKFHPLALVYGQKDNSELKEIICNDPIGQHFQVLDYTFVKKILQKYRASLLKFLNAKEIGVLVTIKPGQEQFRPALFLEKKYPHKTFHYFIDNVISFDQLENFPFIQLWVNTACPRVGFDDQENFQKGVINLNDALMAEEILSKESILNQL